MDPYLFIGLTGAALQVCVLHTLIRGPYREFPGITFYLAILFLTGAADAAIYIELGGWPDWYREYYYLNNTARHLSGFAALVSLVYLVNTGGDRRASVLRISLAALSVIGASALLARGTWPDQYMNEASRNLSFATVILNTILWLHLVKNRTKDTRLFLISGGLGLNMAGEAIGQSVLRMSAQLSDLYQHAGNVIGIGSHLLCLFIWWKAFRSVKQEDAPAATSVPSR